MQKDKPAPIIAEVSRCQGAVQTYLDTLTKDQTPQQAYRNLAHANRLLLPWAKVYGQGCREANMLAHAQSHPSSEAYAQIQANKEQN